MIRQRKAKYNFEDSKNEIEDSQSDSLGDLLADWWEPERAPPQRAPEREAQLPKKPALVSVVCFCICLSLMSISLMSIPTIL
jgi:hypothetical protein